jgi:hypothetical protein
VINCYILVSSRSRSPFPETGSEKEAPVIGRRSLFFSLLAFVLLAILLLLMTGGPAASEAVIYLWFALFCLATASAITGLALGIIGMGKPGKRLAAAGLAAGVIYAVTVFYLLTLFFEFLRSVTD